MQQAREFVSSKADSWILMQHTTIQIYLKYSLYSANSLKVKIFSKSFLKKNLFWLEECSCVQNVNMDVFTQAVMYFCRTIKLQETVFEWGKNGIKITENVYIRGENYRRVKTIIQ